MRSSFALGTSDVTASLWAGNAPPAEYPCLDGDAEAAITVVGAGHMGASLTLHLAQLGTDVALLEAKEPGWGASGRHAGHVVPQWQTQQPARAAFGERAERVLELHAASGDLVYRLAKTHAIECDALQAGHLTLAHSERAIARVERLVRELSDLGAPVELLGRERTREMVGSSRYFAAALNRSGGRINPLAFVRGIVRAGALGGARVHTRSPVCAIERVGIVGVAARRGDRSRRVGWSSAPTATREVPFPGSARPTGRSWAAAWRSPHSPKRSVQVSCPAVP